MVKKIIALVLAGLMIFPFAACKSSGADTSKQVTLTWVINQDKQKDTDVVEKEINNLLAKLLPNTKLEIVHSPNLFDKWSMWMSAKKSFDIAYTGFQTDMMAQVNADSYMELDDLVDKYAPNLKSEEKEFPAEYKSGRVSGKLYAIPNVQSIVHQTNYLTVDAAHYQYFPTQEFLNEMHENPKTTDKAYQLLDGFLAKLAQTGLISSGAYSVDVQNFFNAVVCRGYDFVGTERGGAWLCYDAHDKNAEIKSFVETDEYKLWLKWASDWYQKGYISQDYIVTGATGNMLLSGNVTEQWSNLDEEIGIKYSKNIETGNVEKYNLLLDSEDNLYQGTTIFGSAKTYEIIPYTAKNPERAMMLLDLLHSEKGEELYNLICYGFEKNSDYAKKYGVWHYELKTSENDSKPIAYGKDYLYQPDSSNDYGIAHWRMGNIFHAYRTPNILDGMESWAKDYLSNGRQKLQKTKYYGFQGDLKEYTYKIAQINSAMEEYNAALISGTLTGKWEKTYNTMVEKMNAAGLSEVVKGVQKQADDFNKK